MAAQAVKGRAAVQHYYAIAERGREGGWFLTFPGGTGYSFAESAEQIVGQAQDWLATAATGAATCRTQSRPGRGRPPISRTLSRR